jgi:hypothetical protein
MTYAINYQGLRQRQTYDELVDYLLDKQPKIIYPDRRAKFIRNSPQLSNLLDGDGMGAIYWEEQQINRMKQEQKEHAIRQAGGTAQHLRAVDSKTQTDNIKSTEIKTQTDNVKAIAGSTQTMNPKMSTTGSQAWKPNVASGGVQTEPGAQYFDMTLDDNRADLKEDLDMALDDEDEKIKKKRSKIKGAIDKNLGGDVTQQQTNFVHQIVQPPSSSGASSSTSPAIKVKKVTKKTGDPEKDHEPKGKVGRPKKNADERAEQLNTNPEQSVPMDSEKATEKRERRGSVSEPKKKAKAKKQEDEEERKRAALLKTAIGYQKKEEKKYSPEQTQSSASAAEDKASAAAEASSSKSVRKTIEKKQIPPSQIGIQRVRELLEEAKNNNKLSTEAASDYKKLYDEWVAAKRNKKLKEEKLKGLREIYKRELYKK